MLNVNLTDNLAASCQLVIVNNRDLLDLIVTVNI